MKSIRKETPKMENLHLAELMVEERIIRLELFRAYSKFSIVILILFFLFFNLKIV